MENFNWDFDEEEYSDTIDLNYCINEWKRNRDWQSKKIIKVNYREDFDKFKKFVKSKLYRAIFDFGWDNCIKHGIKVYLILNDNGQVQHINDVYENEVIQLSYDGDTMVLSL